MSGLGKAGPCRERSRAAAAHALAPGEWAHAAHLDALPVVAQDPHEGGFGVRLLQVLPRVAPLERSHYFTATLTLPL